MYDFNPLTPLDLLQLPILFEFIHKERVAKSKIIKKLHEKDKTQIQQQIERYIRYKHKEKIDIIF